MTNKTKINFVSKFPVAVIFSVLMLIGSVVMFFQKGINYGVDFRGGAEIQINFEGDVNLKQMRDSLEKNGFFLHQFNLLEIKQIMNFLLKLVLTKVI